MNAGSKSISVALCTYNGAKYLSMQLDSILRQTHPATEIIIVDDCSSDETLDIIKDYSVKSDIIKYFVNEHNIGYVRNFSLAISKTSCAFVALADQDDIWTDNHLELLINNIGEKAICVGDSLMVDAEGKETGYRFSELKQNAYIPDSDVQKAYRIIYNYNPYQGAAMLINRKWVEDFLPFPKGVSFHDTHLAGCASLTKGLTVIPNVVNRYRMHEDQVTTLWRVSIFDELRRKYHHICFPNKLVIIDCVLKYSTNLSKESIEFINEFKRILDYDKCGKRLKALCIKNRHYKEIFSCRSHKYILLRSLHFLFAF